MDDTKAIESLTREMELVNAGSECLLNAALSLITPNGVNPILR